MNLKKLKKTENTIGIDGKKIINDIETFKYLFNRRQLLGSQPNIVLITKGYSNDLLLDKPFELNQETLDNIHSKEEVVPLVFSELSIIDAHEFYGELFEMGLLKAKKLSLKMNSNIVSNDTSYNKFNQILSKICGDSNSNGPLKSIEIGPCVFDIGSIVNTNKMKNLESLSFPLNCDQLFNNLCLPSTIEDSVINQAKSNWVSMVQSLSTNQYLKTLKLFELSLKIKLYIECVEGGVAVAEIISHGLKQIVQTNKSITSLELNRFDWFSTELLIGLQSNQTIKRFSMVFDNIIYRITKSKITFLFESLINLDNRNENGNKSLIRHFKINVLSGKDYLSKMILELLKDYPNSSLYSITFPYIHPLHYYLFVELLSNSNLTIKEFNLDIYCCYFDRDLLKKFKMLISEKIKDKGIIINFTNNYFTIH